MGDLGVGVTPSTGVLGTTTNDNAAAGSLGEFVTSKIATPGTTLTTNTAANITSISLTAGDWDVSAMADFLPSATTNYTDLQAGLGTTTGTLLTQAGGGGVGTDPVSVWSSSAQIPGTTAIISLELPPVRVLLAATTTIFFVAQATFSAGTFSAFGTIRARRMR